MNNDMLKFYKGYIGNSIENCNEMINFFINLRNGLEYNESKEVINKMISDLEDYLYILEKSKGV